MVSIEVFQTILYLIGAISNNLAKFSTSYLESLGLPTHTVMLWWGVGEGLWGGEGDELDRSTSQDPLRRAVSRK